MRGIIPHAVYDRASYAYDQNGNMTTKLRYKNENPEIGEYEDYEYEDTPIKDENYTYNIINKMIGYSSLTYETGQ